MQSVYDNLDFKPSTLTFSVFKDSGQTDEMGNRQGSANLVTLTCQLDPSSSGKLKEKSKGVTSDRTEIYQGHVIKVVPASGDAYPRIPDYLPVGIVGDGVVNGKVGKVRLLPIEQTSFLPAVGLGFGERIRVEFTFTTKYESQNQS